MTEFFAKSKTVSVSRISKDGWWIENTDEHVAKGTALGGDFTQNIYTPSNSEVIAKYDRVSKTWLDEILNMTFKKYWGKDGGEYAVGTPDGNYPNGAILLEPPKYNNQTQTVLYDLEHGWSVFEILIGKNFYNEFGHELLVADYNFALPDNHSWTKPPKPDDGFAVELVNGKWEVLRDYRDQLAYAKDRGSNVDGDYLISKLGAIPNTHTLDEPKSYDSWDDNSGWYYDIERHRPFKILEEKAWRDNELTNVLNRIDQYEKDKNYAEELRTSPIKSHDEFLLLLNDRKVLSDYPDLETFPFGVRPLLSGLVS